MLKRIVLGYFFCSVMSLSAQNPCFNLVIQEMSSSCEGMFDGELMAFTDAVNPQYLWLDSDTNELFPSQETQSAVNLQPGEFLLQITDENGCVEFSEIHLMDPLDSTNVFIDHNQSFDVDPVSFNTWTECEVQITNLGCDGHFKPHYAIEHDLPISQGDFQVEYWRTLTSTWDPLYYDVVDGVALGYYGDELGEDLGAAGIQTRKIRVRFSQNDPTANLGLYTAYLTVFTADEEGNVFDLVSNTDTLTVELVSLCESFAIDHIFLEEASCANISDGSLLVGLSGGATPYSYSVAGGEFFQSEASFDSLAPGMYALQLMDTNNCVLDSVVSLGPSSLMLDTLQFSGVSTSTLTLQWNTSALVDGYRFRYKPINSLDWTTVGSGVWDDGIAEMLSQKFITALLTDTEYEFQIKVNSLSDGCEEGWSESYYVSTLSIELSATIAQTCASVAEGSIEIMLDGGLPPYTILWSGPNGFTADSVFIDNLLVGDYELYIEDASIPAIVIDTLLSIEPLTSLSYMIGAIDISCCGLCDGKIELDMLNVSSTACTFLINDEVATFPENEVFFYDLCAGDYTLEIIDSMSCVWTENLNILDPICLGIDTVNFMTPESAVIDPSCYGDNTGAIYVSGSGGAANYEFSINNSIYQNEAIGGVGNELFDGLAAGEYWVNIKDENACFDSIYVVVDSAPPIVVNSLALDTAFCYGMCYDTTTGMMDLGAIYLTASGGTLFPPEEVLQFSLDQDSTIYQYGGTFDSLLPGMYSVNVKDDEGCVLELNVEVPQYALNYDFETTDVSCAGNADGQFEITQLLNTNGTEQFYINGDSLNGIMTELAAGGHQLNVSYQYQEVNSCWCSDTFTLLEPLPISMIETIQNPTCRESCDGSIQLSVEGGVPPYLFNWSNKEVTAAIDNLCGGFYSVQLQDSQGCNFFEQYSVIDPTTIYPILILSNDTLIVLEPTIDSPTAGTPPYAYQWFLDEVFLSETSEPYLIATVNGEYMVQVVDSSNCEGISSKLNVQLSSVVDYAKLLNLELYPNPTNGEFFLQPKEERIVQVEIYDSYSRNISFKYEQLSLDMWSLDLLDSKNGTYFVKITTDKSIHFRAIVLNRN